MASDDAAHQRSRSARTAHHADGGRCRGQCSLNIFVRLRLVAAKRGRRDIRIDPVSEIGNTDPEVSRDVLAVRLDVLAEPILGAGCRPLLLRVFLKLADVVAERGSTGYSIRRIARCVSP